MSSAWQSIDNLLSSLGIRFGAPTLGQTTGGGHVDGSYHYLGTARDYGHSNSDLAAISNALVPYAQGPDAPIVELFDSTDNIFYKDGQPFTPSAALRQEHYDHVHAALRPGATLDGAAPAPAATPVGLFSGITNGARRVALEAVFVAGGIALVFLGAWRLTHGGTA